MGLTMRPCDDHAPKSRAFCEGYAAFERNQDSCDCPEEFGSEAYVDWQAGWEQASEVDWERRQGEGQP